MARLEASWPERVASGQQAWLQGWDSLLRTDVLQVKEQVFSRVKKCHTGVEGERPRSQATAYVSPLVSRALGVGESKPLFLRQALILA